MTAPALKARPAPVMTIARTERSNSIESSAAVSALMRSLLSALSFSGRFRVSNATGSHGRSRGRSRQANSTHPHVSRIHHPVSQSLAKYQYGGLRASLHSHSLLSDDSNLPFDKQRGWVSA